MKNSIRSMKLILLVVVCMWGLFFGASQARAADTTYYVDSIQGDDTYDGQSEATPWKTLDKVSSMTFEPGDIILFKAGSQWQGSLKLKGSGVQGNPIVVDMYGTGLKPLLQPGDNWIEPYLNQPKEWLYNVEVNNVVELFNVSYWEINNLEIFDPNFEQVDPHATQVYRRGVYVGARDTGKVSHIYLKNLHVHGFRGPSSNNGKDSGGIIFNVSTNPYDAALRQETWFDDILIEGNIIEEVGRSGINFITPWGTRAEENGRWANFPHVTIGKTWKGHTNVRIVNNVIRNIDGDGIILDTLDSPVCEYNLISHAGSLGVYSAGVFPWKSDHVVIQYNELCYEQSTIDGQGVEIDALNQDVIVQYNYSHHNRGGFIGYCNYNEWVSYDGTFRYNISENDYDAYSVIRLSSVGYNSQVYNNTVYMGPGTTRSFLNTDWVYNPGEVTVYNNIFYNAGQLLTINWKESHIDWKNNLYYGFATTPSNDTAKVIGNPQFVSPGTGGNMEGYGAVEGYKLLGNSPAINRGRVIANNGGKDYFGQALYINAPDIGAVEFTGQVIEPSLTIDNPGFETGTTVGWNNWGGSVTTADVYQGTYAGAVSNQSSIEQVIQVQPGKTYTLSAWAKSDSPSEPVMIGVKNHGGSQVSATTASSTYTQLSVTFTTGATANTATIFLYKPSGTSLGYGDAFTIEESMSFDPNIAYTITNSNSSKVLDVEANSTRDGANVIQWTANGGVNQKWNIIPTDDGYYQIVNVNSGKAIDVAANSVNDGANILQWTLHLGANQKWQIVPVTGGYQLISVHSGKALSVENASIQESANVIQWSLGGLESQVWTILP